MITSRITSEITDQRFELIRARIAEILYAEYAAQAAFETDQQIKAILQRTDVIYAERFAPLNDAEIFAINLFYFSSDFSDKTNRSVRGMNTFVIDFVGNSPSTNRESGDAISAMQIQRIAGMTRAILDSPNWNRLGFDSAPFFVERTEVKSIKRTEEENTRDATNIMLYRMIFNVQCSELVDQGTALPLAGSDTTVKIEDTDLGYLYVYEPS